MKRKQCIALAVVLGACTALYLNVKNPPTPKKIFTDQTILQIVPIQSSSIEKKMGHNQAHRIEIKEINARLNELKKCISGGCSYSEKDPRSYELELAKSIQQELSELLSVIKRNKLVDDEFSIIAQEYLKFPNGFVKSTAVDIIKTQPPNTKNLEALIENVLNYHDGFLVEKTLEELVRYQNYSDKMYIEKSLATLYQEGSLYTREYASRHSRILISNGHEHFFKVLVTKLRKGSKERTYIESALY